MVWLGIAIVIGTFWLIYKNYEARLVLFLSGMAMTLLGIVFAGSSVGFSAAVTAFVKQLVNGGLVPTYTTVMGFGYVMSYTKCADHLVNALVRPLSRVPMLVIPGAVIITWFLNIVLPSAVGIAAAVGVLLIPALIALKVRPVMAAAAVFLGTWGSVASPGLMFNPQVADIAYKAGEIDAPDAMIVIMAEFLPALSGAVVASVVLAVIALLLKEGVNSQKEIKELAQSQEVADFKVNYLYALVPILPLFLLVIASKQIGWLPSKVFTVPCCMLIGTGVGLLIGVFNKQNSGEITKRFCRGCGDAFCEVAMLIAAAAVFASGMKSIGLTGALVDTMKGSQSIAMVSAAIGPWLMAVVCGSGNAAALAFNEVITPHAADFGMTVVQLGAVAQVAAGLGRTISPVAGGVIVIASIAGVNPIEICKRTFMPVCVALAVFTCGMYLF
jgi:DcuC family C4-dicarboxylate transporter